MDVAHKPAINPFLGILWGELLHQETYIKVFIARSEILINFASLVLKLPCPSPGPVHSSIFFFLLIKNQKGKKNKTLNSQKQKVKKCLPGVTG